MTACTGSSSTKSTTTTTTTTVNNYCDRDTCGGGACTAAANKRDLAPTDTGIPSASPTNNYFVDSIRYRDQDLVQSDILGTPDYSAGEVNLTRHVTKRDVPPEGTEPDRDDFYRNLNAKKINLHDDAFGETAVMAGIPNGQDIRVVMEELTGCMGVFVVSHNGTYCMLNGGTMY